MITLKNIAILLVVGSAALSIAAPKTVIFQQGIDGYSGCSDNELRSPAQNYDDGPVEQILTVSEL